MMRAARTSSLHRLLRGSPLLLARQGFRAASPLALLTAGAALAAWTASGDSRRLRIPLLSDSLLRFHFGPDWLGQDTHASLRQRMLADLSRSLLPARRFLGREAAFYHR